MLTKQTEMKRIIFNNFRLVTSILLVVSLIMIVNWLNERHLVKVKNHTDLVYEGRLKAQGYLSKLNVLINLEIVRFENNDLYFQEFKENKAIEELIYKVGTLKLNTGESLLLNDLKKSYLEYLELVRSAIESNEETSEIICSKITLVLDQISTSLYDLENIIFDESINLPDMKIKSLSTSKLLLHVEIAFLIIFGIIFQIIMLYPMKPEGNV